jgi:hypothetical protein
MSKLTRKETGFWQGWRENDRTTQQKRSQYEKDLRNEKTDEQRMHKDLPKEGN